MKTLPVAVTLLGGRGVDLQTQHHGVPPKETVCAENWFHAEGDR